MGKVLIRAKGGANTSGPEGKNAPAGFYGDGTTNKAHQMVWPGDIIEIPDDPVPHLDSNGERIETVTATVNRNSGEQKSFTEKERREFLIKKRAIQNTQGFYPAHIKPADKVAYEKKQLALYLKYMHFAPTWMELAPEGVKVGDDKGWGAAGSESKPATSFNSVPLDKTLKKALAQIEKCEDVEQIEAWTAQEIAGDNRPEIMKALDSRSKKMMS